LGWTSNRFLVVGVVVSSLFGLALVAIPALADLLGHGWPPAGAWVVILAAPLAVVAVDAMWKRSVRRRASPDERAEPGR
jgi:uncharacterized membrane protein YbhN (UPF0104 family)